MYTTYNVNKSIEIHREPLTASQSTNPSKPFQALTMAYNGLQASGSPESSPVQVASDAKCPGARPLRLSLCAIDAMESLLFCDITNVPQNHLHTQKENIKKTHIYRIYII